MNIIVLVKSAIDDSELRPDQSGRPVLKGAATKMSNFDANGVEAAVALKDKQGGTVTVLSLGGIDSKKAIKEALAMGGTRAVHILTGPADSPDSLGTAYSLAKAIERLGGADLVVCSEGASDTYQGLVGPMVAEFLGLPFLAYARRVEVDGGTIRCEQGLEGVVKVLAAKLPAVVSVVSETNQPRYPTLLQVMVAGKKPIEEVPFSSLKEADALRTAAKVLDVVLQSSDRKKVMIEGPPEEGAEKLIAALRQEGVL